MSGIFWCCGAECINLGDGGFVDICLVIIMCVYFNTEKYNLVILIILIITMRIIIINY